METYDKIKDIRCHAAAGTPLSDHQPEKDALDAVKRAEKEADRIVEEAKAWAAKTVRGAERDTQTMIDRGNVRSEKQREELLKNAEDEATLEAERIRTNALDELHNIRKDAAGRIDEAVRLVVDKVVGESGG